MRYIMQVTIFTLISLFIFNQTSRSAIQSDTTAVKDTVKTSENDKKEDDDKNDKKKKAKEPKFEEVIEDYEKIEGFFTLYRSEKEGKVYMEIRQDQLGSAYLCNITRQSGDALLFDSGAMLDEFPFFLKIVGKKVQFIRKNVAFRASSESAIQKALERGISNSLWGSAKIASQPHPEVGSILIDASEIFLQDYSLVGYLTGEVKRPYSFDKDDSYFSLLKSFPFNTEIEVTLHFKSSKPQPMYTLSDSRSMFHRYYFSLAALPETDYQPRLADDRIGHFVTIYQDYSSLLEDTPYRRYITRWNLEKSESKFKTSKPRKPIVFWIENTVPVEYRDAVKEGILLWNDAFQKIGFEDALEVKQMPDDADWDPADVRYSTIRWIVQPEAGYAVGPSRANPFTGQIYDADIRVSADYVRFYYREFGEFITPLSWSEVKTDQLWPFSAEKTNISPYRLPYQCEYSNGMRHQMGFGWSLLLARDAMKDNTDELKKFIHDGIVDLIVHEVGHTLGLRHNFKASSTIKITDLTNKQFTLKEGISGSVMDYNAINLSPRDQPQGNYFQTTLGAYDYWAIEYSYKPLDPNSKISEQEMLEKIAQRVADQKLQYGTDEDVFGLSTRGIDPTCSLWDLGHDPLQYYQQRTQMAQELWRTIPDKFEIKGERYQKFRLVFGQGLTEYAIAAANLPKFIGGIYSNRDHIGDPNGRPPFEIVPAETQRQALQMITDTYFSPTAFQFSPDLLNKLASESEWDFMGTPFRRTRIDYPIHGIVQVIQASVLFRLYDPLILQRLQDNEIRFPKGKEIFTMAEMFSNIRNVIWQELDSGNNINSFKRELQRMHLYVLNTILLKSPLMIPHDATTLARSDLIKLQTKIDQKLKDDRLDIYTVAHLQETQSKILAILQAQFQRTD
jgi:hypothetical protein